MTPRRTGFRTYRSNRTEVLCEQLAMVTAAPLSDPITPELVVVQGRGMELWLNQRLAKQHGIWSNVAYVYPKNFMAQVLDWAGASDASGMYSPEAIGWVLLRKIPELADKPGFGGLGRYLADDVDGLKLFQLSGRLADTFDQYLTFRPDMLREWDGVPTKGRRPKEGQLDLFGPVGTRAEDAAWQSALWRVVVTELGERHPAAIELDVLQRLSSPEPLLDVPERVSVFGISTLPPAYVRLLLALSAHTEVHLFLLSPCREFWDDLSRRSSRSEPEAERLPATQLLVALGQQGAEFQRVVSRTAEELGIHGTMRESELYVDPGTSSTLTTLQHEMLTLSRGETPSATPDSGRTAVDGSITVLSCHSPMREVEVLNENLLDLLATGSGYRPEDIVVMAPNIEDYAPLVEAVMARQRHDARAIPYTIADRSVRADSAVIDAILGALRLSGSRVTASEVLDLLKLEVVHRRFALDAANVEVLAEWVVAANIRWGVDGAHRESFGQPGVNQNTWDFGLARLLLGTALAPRGKETFRGVHPFADVEGTLALLVGKLAEYCDALFSALGSLGGEKPLREWQACLGRVLDTLVAAEASTAWQHEQLRKALDELAKSAESAGFTGTLGRSALLGLLERDLDQRLPARGFLSGGVTFCAMVPMRSIPFKVVYLLGLNDTVFPRHTRAPDFDLIRSGKPRDGDRSRRKDDRNLFLESILAARERLYLSYVGQSVRDNSELPPSVVLSELVDCLVDDATRNAPESGRKDAAQATLTRLLIRHPLQPFSHEYFTDPDGRLWTFQEEYARAAQSLVQAPAEDLPFLSEGLPPPERLEIVTLTDLTRFFRSPAQSLMTGRLGVFIGESEEDIPDREPIELDELSHYGVGEDVLGLLSQGSSEEALQTTLTAQGDLPFRSLGRRELDRVLESARPIAKRLREVTAGGTLPSLWLDRVLPSGTRLQGTLSNRYANGIVRHGFARVRSKKLLEVWIDHLAQCLENPTATSTLIGRPAKATGAHVATFRPVADPTPILEDLVQCFLAGQSEALPFFPEASLIFAKSKVAPKPTKGGKGDHPFLVLKEDLKWNPYLKKLLGENGRLTETGPVAFAAPSFARFDELALRVCGPLLEHLDEVTAQAATAEERAGQEEATE